MADEQKVPNAVPGRTEEEEDGSGISRPTHVKRLLSVTVGPNQELQVCEEAGNDLKMIFFMVLVCVCVCVCV